ncbi:RapZ C-terminal domain-containing protein [Streptomyces sp. NPDC055287]
MSCSCPSRHRVPSGGEHFRNPHHEPVMRYRTGLKPQVRGHVLVTPGANTVINEVLATTAVLYGCAQSRRRVVKVTVACRGFSSHKQLLLGFQ